MKPGAEAAPRASLGRNRRAGTGGPEPASQHAQDDVALALAQALSSQLASAQPAPARVQIGVSFRSRDGTYCRS